MQKGEPQVAVRYTFSLPHELYFGPASSLYVFVYDNGWAIDRAMYYSYIYPIGKDSLLYVQVVPEKSSGNGGPDSSDTLAISGYVSNLILYYDKQRHIVTPPLFDPYMSSYCIINNNLFYWGFKDSRTYACRYNLKTGTSVAAPLFIDEGTDFFGAFSPPYKSARGLRFHSEGIGTWILSDDLKSVVDQITDPNSTGSDTVANSHKNPTPGREDF
jgi:hypothetical protein